MQKVKREAFMKLTEKLKSFQKPTGKELKSFLLYCLTVVAGNAIAAAACAFFITPNHLVMGGTTGLGIFMENMFPEVGNIQIITVYTANIILFIIGAILLGKQFALATLAGSVIYPSFMWIFNTLNDVYMEAFGDTIGGVDNPLLNVICGSLLFGAGIGLVVRVGASTGGTDIPPLIIHKFFGLPVAATMWVLDFTIVFMQLAVPDMQAETIIYGVLICLFSSLILDQVALIGSKRMQVKIISHRYKEIRAALLNELNCGVTMLFGKTGYLLDKCYVLLTVVSKRTLVKLRNVVQRIDPEAFITMSVVSEVRGRGFTSERITLPKEAEGVEQMNMDDLIEVSPEEIDRDR